MKKVCFVFCIGILFFLAYIGIINTDTDRQICDLIYDDNYIVMLFNDGSIWSYGDNSNGMTGLGVGVNASSFQEVNIGERTVSIHKNSQNILAYTENGNVYGWGKNSLLMLDPEVNNSDEIFYKPVKIPFQNKLLVFASKNDKYFAVDENNHFYAGGYIPPDGIKSSDFKNGKIIHDKEFTNRYGALVSNTEKIFPGAGNYNYFIKNDGTVYSIMGYAHQFDSGRPKGYIFPSGGNIIRKNNPDTNEAVMIAGNQEIGTAYRFFEVKNIINPKLIEADNYTMFYLDDNDNAFYWYSERIKYREDDYLLYREHSPYENNGMGENYEGQFININEIAIDEKIIDIKSAEDNTLFLTSNGNVWISKYKIVGTEENISYYVSGVSRPYPGHVETRESVSISDLTFEKLGVANIKYISTNGIDQFITIDAEGSVICWTAMDKGNIIKSKEINLSFSN